MSLSAVPIGGLAGSFLTHLSLRRPTGALLVLLSASVDEIFTWCATAPGCMGVSLCGDTHASREYC